MKFDKIHKTKMDRRVVLPFHVKYSFIFVNFKENGQNLGINVLFNFLLSQGRNLQKIKDVGRCVGSRRLVTGIYFALYVDFGQSCSTAKYI